MEIQIEVMNSDGEVLFRSISLGFESAGQELGKAERYVSKLEAQAEVAVEAQLEEEALEKNDNQNQ